MVQVALLIAFPSLMAYAAVSDLLTMTIPNRISLALVGAFIILALLTGLPWHSIVLHAGAGAAVLGVSFTLFAFGWIGGGDAKLAAATAVWLGFDALVEYLFVASLAGGALTLGILLMRQLPLPAFAIEWPWLSRLHDRGTGIPYGIALAAAALFVYPHCAVWAALAAGT